MSFCGGEDCRVNDHYLHGKLFLHPIGRLFERAAPCNIGRIERVLLDNHGALRRYVLGIIPRARLLKHGRLDPCGGHRLAHAAVEKAVDGRNDDARCRVLAAHQFGEFQKPFFREPAGSARFDGPAFGGWSK
jgi:hypothetical protein